MSRALCASGWAARLLLHLLLLGWAIGHHLLELPELRGRQGLVAVRVQLLPPLVARGRKPLRLLALVGLLADPFEGVELVLRQLLVTVAIELGENGVSLRSGGFL